MEYIKCTNCKGTGLINDGHGPKNWKKCPICKGTGKKKVKDSKGGKSNGNN